MGVAASFGPIYVGARRVNPAHPDMVDEVRWAYDNPLFQSGVCSSWNQWYIYPGHLNAHRTSSPRPVIIKFAEYYCEEAHHLLAERNLAPRLHLVSETLDGHYKLIVMDRIADSLTLDEWCATNGFKERDQDSQQRLLENLDYQWIVTRVKLAIQYLHDAELVFGDLRSSNILIQTLAAGDASSPDVDIVDGAQPNPPLRVYLIDFDWTGRANRDVYHIAPNPHIRWHEDVHPWKRLQKEHDLHWLARLERGEWWSSFNRTDTAAGPSPTEVPVPLPRRSPRNSSASAEPSSRPAKKLKVAELYEAHHDV
jgi:serine/threonine protein kinase